ncbi:hypothetical protein HYZ78_03835 [Candidatus Microgenomates bacterium]|nr:hypothetical protein [Candidatus Microgenomates bacterium]
MNAQRINITLPADLARDLRGIVPEGSRSEYIAKVLKEKFDRNKNLKKEWAKSLRANRKLYQEVHKDWAPLDTEGWPE